MSDEPDLVEVEDDGLLPVVARISANPPRYLSKRGRVGGPEGERGSLAITSDERARALDFARAPSAEWELDPDLGIELLVSGASGVAEELLIPRFLYRRADRFYEYAAAIPDEKKRLAALIRQGHT
jgi:hypothetical protein